MDYENAIAEYSEVLELDSANVQAYLGFIKAYVALDNFAEANKILEAARQNISDNNIINEMDNIIKAEEPFAHEHQQIAPPKEEKPSDSNISLTYIPAVISDCFVDGNFFNFTYRFVTEEIDGIKLAECNTFISSSFPSRNSITVSQDDLILSIDSWKNAGLFTANPALSGTHGFMIEDEYTSYHGEKVTVYLLTINSNYEPVGYSIIEVDVP